VRGAVRRLVVVFVLLCDGSIGVEGKVREGERRSKRIELDSIYAMVH
jgi:hypothetical protein